MLLDSYITTSNPRIQKRSAECNVKEFYEKFETFYHNFRAGKNPDLPHPICDPYGFALLCIDYKKKENNPIYLISCFAFFYVLLFLEFQNSMTFLVFEVSESCYSHCYCIFLTIVYCFLIINTSSRLNHCFYSFFVCDFYTVRKWEESIRCHYRSL